MCDAAALITHADGSRCFHHCLSVFFPEDTSKTSAATGSPNMMLKCSTMSLGNPFLLGSNGQGHDAEKNSAGVGICTLVSDGFF